MTKELIGKLRELSDRESLSQLIALGLDDTKNLGDWPQDYQDEMHQAADVILAAGFSRATVPDAATATVKVQVEFVGDLLIEELKRERDAALAAIERVRAIHSRGETRPGEYFCAYPACEGYWPCPTVKALDGAPEPEWEYGSGPEDALDQSGLHTSRTAAERGVAEWNEFTQRSERMGGRPLERLVLVRRRKAGPWLPAEGESKP